MRSFEIFDSRIESLGWPGLEATQEGNVSMPQTSRAAHVFMKAATNPAGRRTGSPSEFVTGKKTWSLSILDKPNGAKSPLFQVAISGEEPVGKAAVMT